MLTAPTTADLAAFTGRPEAGLGAFAPAALDQAALLFSITTALSEYPTEPDKATLARYAIMELADRLLLEQPHAQTMASPFASETILSYTYTKATKVAKKVEDGLPTGLRWWDLAVDELSAKDRSVVSHSSIEAFERGPEYVDEDGRRHILGPQDLEDRTQYVFYNAERRR